jgi:hypothetical protein
MDNLLDIANKVMEGFDPKTDTVDNFEKIPDGEYSCLLEDVTARKSEKGTEWIGFKFSIMTGDYENRLIFVNKFFTEKTVERSIKEITKLAYDFGYELPADAFTTLETLAGYLNQMAGNQATVKQTTSKNDFTNFKVTPLQ